MEAPALPQRRPHASWVMGRSARWHAPAFLAEMERQEKLAVLADLDAVGASLDGGGGIFGPVLLLRLIRDLWQLHARMQERRRDVP